jgi:two-component system cell cycle sensor histidine kinase/response regulator CckA
MADEGKARKEPAKQLPVHHAQQELLSSPANKHNKASGQPYVHLDAGCDICHILPHAICIISPGGEIMMANAHMKSMFGYNTGGLTGKHFPSLVSEIGRKHFKEYLSEITGGEMRAYDGEMVRKDGGKIWVNIHAVPLPEDAGQQGLLISITEITDYKRIIDELQLGSKLLDTASDSILLRDLDGNFIYANQAAFKTRGYTRDELLKANIYQIVAPEYHGIIEEKVKDMFRKGEVSFEAHHLKKDGSKFPVEIHMSLLETGGHKFILSVVHDATQRKKMEEELYRALKMESVALIAGGIASRFNTLLTHIMGNINVIMNEIEPSTQIYRLLEETDKSVERTRELSRQLMTFSRSGSPIKKTASVSTLLKDTADFVLSGSNVFCNFYISDGLHRAEMDEGQFSQALSNVLLNASQSMPRGGIIDVRARNIKLEDNEVSGLLQGEYIRISVEDHGHGIAAADLPHIFDPYFTTRQGRLGLGLSITYSIIHSHGGNITVDSHPDKGSIFHIYLPAVTGAEMKKEPARKPVSHGIKMLIVDDEAVIRSAGGRLLNRLGYERVEFAANGTEALHKYKEALDSGSPFEIVILDLSIPGSLSGKEVIAALLKLDPKASIMVSSGYFDDPILSDLSRYGIKGVLAKPFKLEELKLMLQEKPEEKQV